MVKWANGAGVDFLFFCGRLDRVVKFCGVIIPQMTVFWVFLLLKNNDKKNCYL